MDNDFGRPNCQMRDLVDDVLLQLDDIGRRDAATILYRAGAPLPVIARVLNEPTRRRRHASA